MKDISSPKQKELIKARIDGINWDGITNIISSASYDYSGSWVGRDYKAFIQVAPYIYKGIIPQYLLEVIVALSILCKYCYYGEIRTHEKEWYAKSVHTSVLRLLRKIKALPPKIKAQFSGKLKYHLLLHLADCIRRFGPPTFTSTEKEESYNQLTRNIISNSNRSAYSYDTGKRFSEHHNLHLILSGSHFLMHGSWMTASQNVRRIGKFLLRDNSKLKQTSAHIHGDRLFANSGASTSIGGFMEFEESKSQYIIIRITHIQKKPLCVIGNICEAVGYDEFGHVVYKVLDKSKDISNSIEKLQTVVNMQHLCNSSCKFSESQKTVERRSIPCFRMAHSTRQLYAFNSFCFSI